MSDRGPPRGFEESWRQWPGGIRSAPTILQDLRPGSGGRRRVERLVAGAPEVVVKVSGSLHGRTALRAHIDYISRTGALDLEDDQGWRLTGKKDQDELVADWTAEAEVSQGRRRSSPLGHSMVLSMPAGGDPARVHDAARAFARDTFGERHEYVFVLHTDRQHPHVHLVVRSRGLQQERFNPGRRQLHAWRETFASHLRERGIEAQATWRSERGITRRGDRLSLRKLLERRLKGDAVSSWTLEEAAREAALAAFSQDRRERPWETAIVQHQARVRTSYLAAASYLAASPDRSDQVLGERLQAFVRAMPPPDTRRLALARELRSANERLGQDRGRESEKDRVR